MTGRPKSHSDPIANPHAPAFRVALLTTPAGLAVVGRLSEALDVVGVVVDEGAACEPARRGPIQVAKGVAKAALRLAGRPDDLYARPPEPPPRWTWDGLSQRGIDILRVANGNAPEAVEALRSWSADLGVVAGGRILKPAVFETPRLGVLNKHSSLLPRARGLAAEYWCLYHGELDALGVTVHFVERGCDTGPVVLQRPMAFEPGDTPGSLRAKSERLGAEALIDAVRLIERTGCRGDAQDESRATKHGRPTPETDRELRAKLPELWRQARDRQAYDRRRSRRAAA
ncbi:MAG: formyl transferase [Planctomycetota bacterium]